MKKVLCMLLLIVAVAGCSARFGNPVLGRSSSKIDRQMAGVQTRADVREKFGTPNLIFDRDGVEYYEYKTVRGHGRYHWMIPVVGWIMSWWQDSYTYRETNLYVGFDGDMVKSYDVIQTSGTVN